MFVYSCVCVLVCLYVYIFVYLYVCICICVFVYLCICVFLYLCYRTFSDLTRRTVTRMAPRKTLKVTELAPQASVLSMSPAAALMQFSPFSVRIILSHSAFFLRKHFDNSFMLPPLSYEHSRFHFSSLFASNFCCQSGVHLNPLTCTKL